MQLRENDTVVASKSSLVKLVYFFDFFSSYIIFLILIGDWGIVSYMLLLLFFQISKLVKDNLHLIS